MEDKKIICACGEEFTFTVGQQEFFAQKGFEDPKRCRKCLEEKRAQYSDQNQNQGSLI